VICDAVAFHHVDEVARRKSGQGGFAEVGVFREIPGGIGDQIGEVTSSPAGDANLLADGLVSLDHENRAGSFPRFDRTHQPGRAGSKNENID